MDRRERDKQARERQMQAERDVEPALPIFAAPVKVVSLDSTVTLSNMV